jgi:chemotaxis protein methyltransferase CheR
VGIVSSDESIVAAARRRLDEAGFEVRVLVPAINLPRTPEAAAVEVVLLDATKHGPLIQRLLDGFPHTPMTAPIPILVLDPESTLDFHPVPFKSVRSLEEPALATILREAADASGKFVKGNAPTMEDLKLSPAALQRFIEFVERRTGIVVEKGASSAAEEIVRKRMHARKTLSVWEYLNLLQFKDMRSEEFQRLVPALTVGETSFFRTQSHFTALKRLVIPDFLARKRKKNSRIRVWSAGCASGEEAYSLAMTFHQEVGDLHEWDFQVLATDISGHAIRRASEGTYSAKEVRRVPEQIRDRYFTRMGDRFIIDRRIQDLVQFRTLNLNAWASAAGFEGVEPGVDLVFCENVIIYFSRSIIEQIIQRFHNVLAPGGYLFLGYSESLYRIQHAFQNISFQQTYFYRKDPSGGARRWRRRTPVEGVPAPSPPLDPLPRIVASPPLLPDITLPADGPPDESAEASPLPESLPVASGDDVPREEERREEGEAAEPPSAELRPAFALIREGRFAEAGEILDAHLEGAPLDPEAHYLRGLAFEGAQEEEEAVRQWRQSLFLDPVHVQAHIRLGDQLARRGDTDSALLHFRNALRALEAGAEPFMVTPEGVLAGPALVDLCLQTVKALEAEEVA